MSLFGPLDNSASGMRTMQTWLDTVASNIANANDTSPTSQGTYAPEWVVAQSDASVTSSNGFGGQVDGGGVHVGQIVSGSTAGEVISDPENPIADNNGMVRQAQVDLPNQMTMMIQAERGYQANVSAISHAKDAYEAALKLGGGS
jgi:flagellar basal-body rod protein FlgC